MRDSLVRLGKGNQWTVKVFTDINQK